MKIKTHKWVLLIIMLGLRAACTSIASDATPTPLSYLIASSIPSSSPTHSPSPTETSTDTPTRILATNTRTPFPPLATDELENKIFELLRTNNGCELPCWWGITPGETRWEDAERLLLYLRFRVSTPRNGDLIEHVGEFRVDDLPYMFIRFIELESGVLDAIMVLTGARIVFSSSFQEDWARYDPAKIISRYGVPSRVIVRSESLVPEPPVPITKPYSVYFFYDELGFYISYSGDVEFKPVYQFCPTFGLGGNLKDGIEIGISKINGVNSLDELTVDLLKYPKYNYELGEITNLSVEEFAELYSGDEPVCFETPRDIWP